MYKKIKSYLSMCKNKTVTFCTFFVCRLTYTKRYTILNGKTKEISNNITIISYGILIIHEKQIIVQKLL